MPALERPDTICDEQPRLCDAIRDHTAGATAIYWPRLAGIGQSVLNRKFATFYRAPAGAL